MWFMKKGLYVKIDIDGKVWICGKKILPLKVKPTCEWGIMVTHWRIRERKTTT